MASTPEHSRRTSAQADGSVQDGHVDHDDRVEGSGARSGGLSRDGLDVRGEAVRTEPLSSGERLSRADAARDPGVQLARERFGGIDIPATLVGMLAALALVLLLGSLAAAAVGAVGYQTGLEGDAEDLSIAALAGGVAIILVSFVVGGWAAARIARYDGGRNGLMTGVWALLLAALASAAGAILGSEYDLFRDVDLPQWFSQDALTAGAIVSGAATVVAMLLGGFLGGKWGERFHRHADAQIVAARPGGIGRALAGRGDVR